MKRKSEIYHIKFRCCQQWQHKESGETVFIMKTNEYYEIHPSIDFNVNILTESGSRRNISYIDFVKNYKHIGSMKGAYK